MTVAELIDVLAEFPADMPVKIGEVDLLSFEDIVEVRVMRDTPLDPEWVVLRT